MRWLSSCSLLFRTARVLGRIPLFETPWTVLCQACFSVRGISQAEYWSGLPFPPPGDLPDPGIEPRSPESPESPALQADPLPLSHRMKDEKREKSTRVH